MDKKFNINTELARNIADKKMLKNHEDISQQNSIEAYDHSITDSPSSATSDMTAPYSESPHMMSLIKTMTQAYDNSQIKTVNIKVTPHIMEKIRVFEKSSEDDTNFQPYIERQRSKSVDEETKTKKLSRTSSYEHLTLPILGKSKSIQNQILLNDDTIIEDVLDYIIHKRLKLDHIDVNKWAAKLKDNLILNYATLCRQLPETIDKLNLPLALENELKSLIISKNSNFFQIKTMDDITLPIKIKMKKSFNYLKDNQKARNIFYDEFYKILIKNNDIYEKLYRNTSIVTKSESLFEMLNLIVRFIENDDISDDLNKIAVKHMIYGINNKSLNVYAYAISESFTRSMDIEYIDESIKEAWYVVSKIFGEKIVKQYEIISHGKNYYIYYRKHKKWHKCFCKITHDKVCLSTYPKNEMYFDFNIADIVKIDTLDQSDNRITKQTIFCISVEYGNINETHYMCVDTKEIMTSIYNDITIRMEAYERIK